MPELLAPAAREAAMAAFHSDIYAQTSKASLAFKWRTITRMFAAWGGRALPSHCLAGALARCLVKGGRVPVGGRLHQPVPDRRRTLRARLRPRAGSSGQGRSPLMRARAGRPGPGHTAPDGTAAPLRWISESMVPCGPLLPQKCPGSGQLVASEGDRAFDPQSPASDAGSGRWWSAPSFHHPPCIEVRPGRTRHCEGTPVPLHRWRPAPELPGARPP